MEAKIEKKYFKSFPVLQWAKRGDIRGKLKYKHPQIIKHEIVANWDIRKHAYGPRWKPGWYIHLIGYVFDIWYWINK